MDSQPRDIDWRSILLFIFSLSGIALTILTAITIIVMVAINERLPPEFQETNTSPLAMNLTAGGLIAVGALLTPSAWLSLQRMRGKTSQSFNLSTMRPWTWLVILVVWMLTITGATLFYDARGANWYVPLLHFLSISLPIYMVLQIGINRIQLGSKQRAWGVFSSGMTLGPILAVLAEVIIILSGLIILIIYFGINPEKAFELKHLVHQLENATGTESTVLLLEPIINNVLTLLAVMLFLSVLVPIIEETVKSLSVWLVVDLLTSPAQGFAMGVLSGAGFAMAESLFASMVPDDTWVMTLFARAFTGGMHMLASGLVGWGIAYARLEKRYPRMIVMNILAMLLHGSWNAGAVLTMAGGLRTMLIMPNFDIVGTVLALGGASLFVILIVTMFTALFILNYHLRTTSSFSHSTHNFPPPALEGDE